VVLYHFSSYFATGRRERKSHNAVAFMVEKGVYVVGFTYYCWAHR